MRRRWKVIIGVTLLSLGLVGVITALTPATYQSGVSFFVSTADTSDSNQLAQGGTFTQQRVKSYTELLKTPKVLQPVAKELKVAGGASALAPKVNAKAAMDTVIIDVAVTSNDAHQASLIAQSIGRHFPESIADLERVSDSKPSPVKVSVIRQSGDKGDKVGPSWATNLALATFLGLLAGITLALIRERTDTKIRTKEDVELASDEATLLGSIPFDAGATKKPLILAGDQKSIRAEAFRSLRTNLRFIDATTHPRVLVITSAIPGEGKSSTTANLALALATSGASVCLVEADLRRPRLLQYLGMEGSVGLTDILLGDVEARTVAQQYGDLPMMVIGAGSTPPNPSELLGSVPMEKLLADLRGRFDYVLLDVPPLLPVTDGAILANRADGAIVVSGAGLVNRDQLQEALDHLDAVNANLLGVVLNRASREGRSSYYDYETFDEAQRPKSKSLMFRDSESATNTTEGEDAGSSALSRRNKRESHN